MTLVAVTDLFFASKIDGALAAAGPIEAGTVVRASRGDDLLTQVRHHRPARLLVDLGSKAFPVLAVVRAMKTDDALRAVEVVGFCRHTESALMQSARDAGVDRILTQGEFSAQVSALLAV